MSALVVERSEEKIMLGKWSDRREHFFGLELSRSGDGFAREGREYLLRRTDVEAIKTRLI